jgi:hypothetical protein
MPTICHNQTSSHRRTEQMFDLGVMQFPTTREQFVRALEAGAEKFGANPGAVVVGPGWPEVASLRIDLTGGEVPEKNPGFERGRDGHEATVLVENLEIDGNPIYYGKAAIDLSLRARHVNLDFSRDEASKVVLGLTSARDGDLTLAISKNDLDALFVKLIENSATKHGISVENVSLHLDQFGDRTISFQAEIRARKLFMSTTVSISGKADLVDQPAVRLSDLACRGSGAIGSVATEILRPQLERWNNSTIPLVPFLHQNIRLKNLTLDTSGPLKIHAQFGA